MSDFYKITPEDIDNIPPSDILSQIYRSMEYQKYLFWTKGSREYFKREFGEDTVKKLPPILTFKEFVEENFNSEEEEESKNETDS